VATKIPNEEKVGGKRGWVHHPEGLVEGGPENEGNEMSGIKEMWWK